MTLKFGLTVIQGTIQDHMTSCHAVCRCNYLVSCSRYLTLTNIMTLNSRFGVTRPANLCTLAVGYIAKIYRPRNVFLQLIVWVTVYLHSRLPTELRKKLYSVRRCVTVAQSYSTSSKLVSVKVEVSTADPPHPLAGSRSQRRGRCAYRPTPCDGEHQETT